MFTGIVEELGTVEAIEPQGDALRLSIRATTVLDDVHLGDSISVNGCCLTAAAVEADVWTADVMQETLDKTSLLGARRGDRVNLERAVTAGTRLGGHIVQGHVDGVGEVASVTREGESALLEVSAPEELLRYVVEKGSITVDGVSLTVAGRAPGAFRVALIPHTMSVTTLGPQALGRRVNLEVDVVAKYVEALVAPYAPRGDR
jgi:riboflavin synthase